MYKNIILFSNDLGQKKRGFEITSTYFNNYLRYRNKNIITPTLSNCLFKNLEKLYNIN